MLSQHVIQESSGIDFARLSTNSVCFYSYNESTLRFLPRCNSNSPALLYLLEPGLQINQTPNTGRPLVPQRFVISLIVLLQLNQGLGSSATEEAEIAIGALSVQKAMSTKLTVRTVNDEREKKQNGISKTSNFCHCRKLRLLFLKTKITILPLLDNKVNILSLLDNKVNNLLLLDNKVNILLLLDNKVNILSLLDNKVNVLPLLDKKVNVLSLLDDKVLSPTRNVRVKTLYHLCHALHRFFFVFYNFKRDFPVATDSAANMISQCIVADITMHRTVGIMRLRKH